MFCCEQRKHMWCECARALFFVYLACEMDVSFAIYYYFYISPIRIKCSAFLDKTNILKLKSQVCLGFDHECGVWINLYGKISSNDYVTYDKLVLERMILSNEYVLYDKLVSESRHEFL